ncbi:hypothetical protein GCM10022261_19700 [Brevibacterium daeguense]|uniref:SIS domain-containing protein n=1 Tax=Brevibacterium daeguense TaxID=909936 RepID=A0ABP8EKD5_9MICO
MHVAALSQALADRGHSVTVFTRRDDPALPDLVDLGEGVTVVNITAGPAAYVPKDEFLPFMDELGRGIAEHWTTYPDTRPDIVHSHFWMSGLAARVALDSAGLTGVPLAHTFHALGTVKRRHQGELDTSPPERAVLEPQVGRDADRIIATCSDEVSELRAFGISPDGVSIVPCGVDLHLFRADQAVEDTAGMRRIVCVGRLVARKGMDLAVTALAELAERGYRDVELHIIGGGASQSDLHEDPEAVRLLRLAEELGVADRLVLRGQVPRDDVPSILRSAAFVACTPWYEPFGIVPLEAMACGVPVVAAEVGGLADTVVHGVTGLHVPPRDPEAVADAGARLLADPALAAELGRNGVSRARERYAWPVVAASTEKVYEELLGSRSRSTSDSLTALDPAGALESREVLEPAGTSADVLHLPLGLSTGGRRSELAAHPSTNGTGTFRSAAATNGTSTFRSTAATNGTGTSSISSTAATNGTNRTGTETTDLADCPGDDGIEEHLDGVALAVGSLRSHAPTLRRWALELADRLSDGRCLFTAGNGGSAAEAQHLSSELVGRFAQDRPAFASIALNTDSSAVTAISNDYGYENVFARQLEAHGRPGDVLVLMTTSGKSPNLLKAAETAHRLGVSTWALTGPGPNPLTEICQEAITVEAASPNVQEAHLMAIHSICKAFDAEIARRGERQSARRTERGQDEPGPAITRTQNTTTHSRRQVGRVREVRL